jgi:hypothetical protein
MLDLLCRTIKDTEKDNEGELPKIISDQHLQFNTFIKSSKAPYILKIILPDGASVRTGIDIDSSALVRTLHYGDIVEALEKVYTDEGVVRYRIFDGWISEKLRPPSNTTIVEILADNTNNLQESAILKQETIRDEAYYIQVTCCLAHLCLATDQLTLLLSTGVFESLVVVTQMKGNVASHAWRGLIALASDSNTLINYCFDHYFYDIPKNGIISIPNTDCNSSGTGTVYLNIPITKDRINKVREFYNTKNLRNLASTDPAYNYANVTKVYFEFNQFTLFSKFNGSIGIVNDTYDIIHNIVLKNSDVLSDDKKIINRPKLNNAQFEVIKAGYDKCNGIFIENLFSNRMFVSGKSSICKSKEDIWMFSEEHENPYCHKSKLQYPWSTGHEWTEYTTKSAGTVPQIINPPKWQKLSTIGFLIDPFDYKLELWTDGKCIFTYDISIDTSNDLIIAITLDQDSVLSIDSGRKNWVKNRLDVNCPPGAVRFIMYFHNYYHNTNFK